MNDTAEEILRLVSVSGADEVYPMANGSLVVLGLVIGEDSEMVDRSLADIGSVDVLLAVKCHIVIGMEFENTNDMRMHQANARLPLVSQPLCSGGRHKFQGN